MTHIVGIIGRKFSGKSTAAGALADNNGFTVVKFADPLKNMLRMLFYTCGYDEEEAEHFIEGNLKEEPAGILMGKTARHAMQTLGTEWGRDNIHKDFWTNLFIQRASQKRLVVCDDCRFENEASIIADNGGVLIRLIGQHDLAPSEDKHPSEVEMDSIPVHHFVHNDGTIMDLYRGVKDVAFNANVERRTLQQYLS